MSFLYKLVGGELRHPGGAEGSSEVVRASAQDDWQTRPRGRGLGMTVRKDTLKAGGIIPLMVSAQTAATIKIFRQRWMDELILHTHDSQMMHLNSLSGPCFHYVKYFTLEF